MNFSITESSCRVCLVEQEIMINIFDTVEDFQKRRLSDLLETCTDIKIDKSDNLSKLICDECTGELLVVVKFHEKCKRTLDILAQIQLARVEDEELKIELPYPVDSERSLLDVDDTDSIIIEEHDLEDEGVETDQNSPEQLHEGLMFEEVGFVDDEMNNESMILFEPEDVEENLSSDDTTKLSKSDKDDHECRQDTVLTDRKKTVRTTVTARPLIINCKCDVCGAGFTHVNNLSRHIQTHSPDVIFTCALCKYPFTTNEGLEYHMGEHQKHSEMLEKDISEETCEISENVQANMENLSVGNTVCVHDTEKVVSTAEEVRKSKICNICSKPFVSKSALEAHIRTHTGDRPFECDLCPKAFKTQGGLALHLRRHSGVRPYTCNVCNKGFGESSNLRVHMRTHTGEKPHKCTICNRSFARVFLLQIHLRTHTGERPYQCPFCDKAFAQGGDLASHKRTHTGERPHVCPFCKKGFIKSSGLTQHMRKHMNHDIKSKDASYKQLLGTKENKADTFPLLIVDDDMENGEEADIKVEDYVIEFPNDIET